MGVGGMLMLLCDDDEVAGSLFADAKKEESSSLFCLVEPSKVVKDSELREMRRTDEP
jgi:hypothetical protein